MCAAARVEGIHSLPNLDWRFAPVFRLPDNRRQYERLPLQARVRLKRVAGKPQPHIEECEGMDISCSGLCFRAARNFTSGTDLDLEVVLHDPRPGGAAVKMFTSATVIRSAPIEEGRDHRVAVIFTDIAISREPVR